MKNHHFVMLALFLMVLWSICYNYITQGVDPAFCAGMAGTVVLTVIFRNSYNAGFRFIPEETDCGEDEQ